MTEVEQLQLYVRAIEAERDHLNSRVQKLEHALHDKHGDAVHRVLDAVKSLKDRIGGGKS